MLKDCMFAGQNMWVLKPNDQNRGRGVTIFNKLEDIKKMVYENSEPFQRLTTQENPQESVQPKILKSDSFII
jgi:hypothetical protein